MQVERGEEIRFSGRRVRNAYAIYPLEGNSNWKRLVILHETIDRHLFIVKGIYLLMDEHASY